MLRTLLATVVALFVVGSVVSLTMTVGHLVVAVGAVRKYTPVLPVARGLRQVGMLRTAVLAPLAAATQSLAVAAIAVALVALYFDTTVAVVALAVAAAAVAAVGVMMRWMIRHMPRVRQGEWVQGTTVPLVRRPPADGERFY